VPITPQDRKRLDQIYSDLHASYGGKKEDYFALLYLTRKFHVSQEEIAHQIAFGGNDYGIDAYYFDRHARNLYLCQFKWSENHDQFKDSMVRLAKEGLTRLFGNPLQDPHQNEFLRYLHKDLREHRELIERVYVQLIFKGDVNAAENSEGLNHRREDIENKQHLLETYFGRDIELQVDFISDRPGLPPPSKSQSFEIRMTNRLVTSHEGRRLYVGFVPLMDLYRIYLGLRQRFFDRNIRAALSNDNTPNRKIRDALAAIVLKDEDQPTVFPFRHNGVTLAAERVDVSDSQVTLHVPRLLNGAQTVSSVAHFLEQQDQNPVLKKNLDKLEEILVLTKIVEDDPSSSFVTSVTIANNQQNPVQPWTLRAMDTRQVDLADKFRQEVGIFYSRQEGAFENLSEDERLELGIEDTKDLRIRPLAQTFLATQGEVANMSQLPAVFESSSLYESTFRTAYLHVDARKIILAYKIGLVINSALFRIRELAPAKYERAVPRLRNLLWALLIQAFLNDPKLLDDLEHYGNSLAKEKAFRDRVEKLTSTRVWPILKEILGSSKYQDRVQQQKFDFLRTKDVYKAAMDIAYEKWRWTKKSF
jgi:hypothetical protein